MLNIHSIQGYWKQKFSKPRLPTVHDSQTASNRTKRTCTDAQIFQATRLQLMQPPDHPQIPTLLPCVLDYVQLCHILDLHLHILDRQFKQLGFGIAIIVLDTGTGIDEPNSQSVQIAEPSVESRIGKGRKGIWSGRGERHCLVVAVFHAAAVRVACNDDAVNLEVVDGVRDDGESVGVSSRDLASVSG